VERYDADSYLARVAENYRRLAKTDATAVTLDGSEDREQVAAAIMATVQARFASNTLL
jgi:thymidylate kinase